MLITCNQIGYTHASSWGAEAVLADLGLGRAVRRRAFAIVGERPESFDEARLIMPLTLKDNVRILAQF